MTTIFAATMFNTLTRWFLAFACSTQPYTPLSPTPCTSRHQPDYISFPKISNLYLLWKHHQIVLLLWATLNFTPCSISNIKLALTIINIYFFLMWVFILFCPTFVLQVNIQCVNWKSLWRLWERPKVLDPH
jgi:hypothetical protein